jgi:hypothetical protein
MNAFLLDIQRKNDINPTPSDEIIMQLSQTGVDKNLLQNHIPGITHLFQLDQ